MCAYVPTGLKDRPIAVFDSGLGGLTVVHELSRLLPGEDIVYLGDSARVPYGIKSLATVRRFALEDAAFVLEFSPKMLVVACNTASAAAIEDLEASCPVPVVDVIRPGVAAALEQTDGPIGVIGTESTIASGAYQRAISAIDPSRRVHTAACPLLVPIVEEGRDRNDPVVLAVLVDYLRQLQRSRLGALILGCTHYPLLAEPIGKLMGPDVTLVSSAQAAAREVQRQFGLADLQAEAPCGGRLRCFTTDDPQRFAQLGERFGGRKINEVRTVGTDELEAAPADRAEPIRVPAEERTE
ncbi:MAG: glutamate racemase [Planctomycetota bacterium]|nr:glutamate racemase [Planctomycetota bacterium]